MFPLWQCSNPIDKTPIGGQGAMINSKSNSEYL